jgi:hypothetical protein
VSRAREQLILAFDEAALAAAADTLWRAARDKDITCWRQKAMMDQLAASHHKKPTSSDLARDREAVKEAARLYNEGITNGFLRLSLFRRHQHQLLLGGTLALLATLVVLTTAAGDLEAKGKVLGWQSCWLAILLGILGAITSAAQRATRVPQQRIRNELGAISASLSRVPIGAVAGLTVWLFSLATSDSTSLDAANMFLAAFGAGFAERLIVHSPTTDRDSTSGVSALSIVSGTDRARPYERPT